MLAAYALAFIPSTISATSSPHPPPSLPPPPIAPIPAGFTPVQSTEEVQAALVKHETVFLYVPEGSHLLLHGQPFNVRGNVTLVSAGDGATLDAQSLSRIADIAVGFLELRRLRLVNGNAIEGGALRVGASSSLTVDASNITNCSAVDGGALFLDGGTAWVSGSTIGTCTAVSAGANARAGAVYVGNGSVLVTDSTISGCIAISRSAQGTADAYGGAIFVEAGSATIRSSAIDGCAAAADVGNRARAGALFVSSASAQVTVSGSTIRGCKAASSANKAHSQGGAVYVDYGLVSISNSNISGCSSTRSSTGSLTGAHARAGALYVHKGRAILRSVAISNCTAATTGEGATANAIGGALFVREGRLTMSDSAIIDCAASSAGGEARGGAIAAMISSTSGALMISSSTITRCTCTSSGANARGGGLFVRDATISISESTISDCSAVTNDDCASCYAYGGLMNVVSGAILLRDGTLLRNGSAHAMAANVLGSSTYVESGLISYILPARLGTWVSAVLCSQTYIACPLNKPACNRTELGLAPVQQCPWALYPEMLGQHVSTIPLGSTEYAQYPFPCGRGFYGQDAQPSSQSGPQCTGLCPAGQACSTLATVTPEECSPGTFCEPGSQAESLCLPGTHQPARGKTACLTCRAGYACDAGAVNETACSPGSFAAEPGSAVCSQCQAGSFQPYAAQSSCLSCRPGSWCTAGISIAWCAPPPPPQASPPTAIRHGLSGCRSVAQSPSTTNTNRRTNGHVPNVRSPQGYYNPELKASSSLDCKQCPIHTTTNSTGARSESDCVCVKGRVDLDQSQAQGEKCGCPSGTFYSSTLQTCSDCPTGTTSPAGSARCEYCATGFYQLNLNKEPGIDSDACELCLDSTYCRVTVAAGFEAGGTIETLTLKAGFWRTKIWTTDIRECERGASGGCVGNQSVGTCRDGMEGPMCQLCPAPNTYYDEGSCHTCPEAGPRVGAFMAFLVSLSAVASWLYWLYRAPSTPSADSRSVSSLASQWLRGLANKLKVLGLGPKLKITISFYQVR